MGRRAVTRVREILSLAAAGAVVWALVHSAQSPVAPAALPARAAVAPPAPIWRGRFPNVALQTHDGRTVHFYDDLLRGRRVTINFMYVECEGTCPGTTQNLVEVERKLGAQAGRDVLLLSITLQPETDTPERLREYAQRYGAGPGLLFLTGKPDDIERLRHALGFASERDTATTSDPKQHAGILRMGNESRDWWTACPSLASPAQILSMLRSLESPEPRLDAGQVKPPLESPEGPPGALVESLNELDHRDLEALEDGLDRLHMARAKTGLSLYLEQALSLMAQFLRLEGERKAMLQVEMRRALDESVVARKRLEAVRVGGSPSARAVRDAWSRYGEEHSRALGRLDSILDGSPRHRAFRSLGTQWLYYLEGHPDHAETRENNR
jgi:protein SCO1/2